MNEIVKYSNFVNALKFKEFTAVDYDFLMMLCAKMKNQNTNRVTFSFSEIKELSGYKRTGKKEFVENLKSMNRKLMSVTTDVQVDNQFLQFVLFPTFITNLDDDILTVSVNQDFAFVLNDLQQNFTRFELEEFISLESKYAKTLYRLIKQFRTTGEYRVSVGEFRDLMGCPPSYTNYVFLRDIIQPSVSRLQQYFPLLKCTVLHAHKKGAPVTGYLFTFQGEDKDQLTIDQGVEEVRSQIEKKEKKPDTKNRFNNFQQREYDFEELERKLLRRPPKAETESVKQPEPKPSEPKQTKETAKKRKVKAVPKEFETEIDIGLKEPYKEKEIRFVLVDDDTGEVVDDAQGYGYKTAQGAHKAYGWKQSGKKRGEKK